MPNQPTKPARKIWRKLGIFGGFLLLFVGATYVLQLLPSATVHQLAAVLASGRYLLFLMRLLLLAVLFVFWQPILNWYAPNTKITHRHKYQIFAVLLAFDVIFILQLPFKGF